jgi:hypothetical protein
MPFGNLFNDRGGDGRTNSDPELVLALEPRPGYLLAFVTGAFEQKPAQALFVRVMEAAIEHRLPKILVDCTGMSGTMSTIQRFEFARFVANRQQMAIFDGKLGEPSRLAVVGNVPLVDPHRFGETVAVNRGAKIRVVDKREEAMQWLEITP